MELIINPYKDPSYGLDWNEQTQTILIELDQFLKNKKESYLYSAKETNHGTATDWPTITLTISGLIGTLFVIPEAHKKIRESYEEWKKIGNELKSFISWVISKYPIVTYPKEFLFFELLEWFELELDIDATELEFISIDDQFPFTNSSIGTNIEKSFLFTFKYENTIHQVAVKNNRKIIWSNSFEIKV